MPILSNFYGIHRTLKKFNHYHKGDKMFHKIKEVKPLKKYILEITFQDNTIKYYDVSKLFEKWDTFKQLKTIDGLFEQAKVDSKGYGISWNEEIDISCDELWENGQNRPGLN